MPLLILRASRQPTLKRDFDRGKKGRKRKIATDTLGCLRGVVVHRANLVDKTMGMVGNGCLLCIPYDKTILCRQRLSRHFLTLILCYTVALMRL